ncbi:methyltransferase-like protein 6 [Phtheirospermum japonicum]|uniref:Methyltransferase-like protein 6 n=1 Tax=Phtheirospermum japonicum TaxID=374723 RepID=A0A830D927_9LAMI|nr:methyltransferase-like protein 6 [Phtheirospermum japonicum]
MSAAIITTPPPLFQPRTVGRNLFLPLPTVRFERLSCTKRGSDDINEHYFSRKSLKCWDKFYKRHQNKFFKDRHYLEKDWDKYFSDNDNGAISADGRVGFGAGNTIFPLIAAYPELFIHACDFSTEALTLVKSHSNFNGNRINAFICDVTNEELCDQIMPSSVDVITLIFMLSAVSPNKMPFVLQNLRKVLKPNGQILFRDYAVGDFAQCSYYFSEDFLSSLLVKAGFETVDMTTYCRQVENRFRNMTFQRYCKGQSKTYRLMPLHMFSSVVIKVSRSN